MAKMMQHKAFAPADSAETARMSSTASKTYRAMTLALRPCGVTAYEAAEAINALGGQPYTPGYVKSAQFAGSYYAPLGYGAYGVVETVGEHVAAVTAAEGAEAGEHARASLPESMQGDDAQVLVLYAYAAGGKAVGRYGTATLDSLPETADDAAERRRKLTGKRKGGQSRKRSSSKGGQQ